MKISNFIKDFFIFNKKGGNKTLLLTFFLIFIISLINLTFLTNKKTILPIEIVILLILFLIFIFSYKNLTKTNFANVIKQDELYAVIQNIEDGIIIYDTEFRIIDFNSGAEKIFNLKKEEVLNQKITPESISSSKFNLLTQVLFPSLASSINTISDSGWPKIVEIIFEKPHLKLKTLLNQVVDEKGKVIAFIKIVKDETREYDILKSKSEFLTVSAHQLRTPLTALSWATEALKKILEDENKNKEAINLINEIWNLVQRSLKIIEDLLNAAKIEEGRFGFNFKNINLVDLLTKIKEVVTPLAKEANINLNFDYKVKEAWVLADEEKLSMAITNLIDNGIKYNVPNGSVFISLEEYLPNKNYFKISVSDTGIGIPEESLKKMFEKFYRAENAQRVEPNGNGLGLYITKNIIEKHKGKIYVESELKRGSTFWFIIPKVEPNQITK
jgi:two-component system phosphate regulon sensor histidine kinase PhoR